MEVETTRELSSSREIRLRDSARTSGFGRSFAVSFDRLTSFGNIHFEEEVKSKGLGYIKKVFDKNPVLIHLWNEILVMLCVIATSLDPLFCYILVVDENRKCVGFDNTLRTIVVVLRSITDFLYIILIVFHFQCGYSTFYNAPGEGLWARAWKVFLSYFTVDILAVLPLPQVVVLFIIPKFRGSRFIIAMRSLKWMLLTQYLPRVFRIYSFLKKVRWTSSILPETAGAKAAFNLFLYMLASHVFGAFWYLFTVERKATCWQQNYQNFSLNCVNYDTGNQNLNISSFCSAKTENGSKSFNFGIFDDALHIVSSRNFIRKISYCYWWGLQKLSKMNKNRDKMAIQSYIYLTIMIIVLDMAHVINNKTKRSRSNASIRMRNIFIRVRGRNYSSLGQDLKTSDYLWEIYFAVTITISGLILFALLVGNLQTYLQSTIARMEEMRLKGQDIELWMAYHSLPRKLKKKIKKYERYKWRETKGVDIEKLLHNLPRDLRRDTKRHLCLGPISKVSKFRNMDERLLYAICDYLKPVLYIERNFIVQEGEPLDEMIFITRGKVLMYSKSDGDADDSPRFDYLSKGDFYGETLLDWVIYNPSSSTVPISTKTIRAHSKVEAFVLLASDLKTVILKFWWLFSRNSPSSRERWAPWAAVVLQLAWRRYVKSKREKMKSQSVIERKNSHNVATPFLASRFVRVLRALREKREKQARNAASASTSV